MTLSSPSTFASVAAIALLVLHAGTAGAQACCAGTGAVTPARLSLHEDALVGVQVRAANQLGSHDADGRFVPIPAHARELDLEQNVFGAVRIASKGQLGVLVPFVETHRRSSGRSSTGGGVGDVNVSFRYDFLLAGASERVPGVGLLVGVTAPTGRTAEDAKRPLATDATGIGAVQTNLGLAFEQVFGRWLAGLSGIVSMRAPRTVRDTRMALAPQYMLLASTAYAFASGTSAALVVSYAEEGEATVDGVTVPMSARRVVTGSISGALPVTDRLRIVGSLSTSPPLSSFGKNQPVTAGASVGVVWSSL